MLWRDRFASIVPRGTWAYGTNLCDGIFNLETVLLRQADVINYGEEKCHHLTVCVVGPPEAGKTSLIRKLSGEKFESKRRPTKLVQTCIIEEVVSEEYLSVNTWKKTTEKTDTDQLIVHRVANRLKEETVYQNGPAPCYVLKLLSVMALCELFTLVSMVYGAQPLAAVCLSVLVGYAILGFNDTAMRMSLACTTNFYLVIGHAMLLLSSNCDGRMCQLDNLSAVVVPLLVFSALWGTVTGFGLNPGIATGLALAVMDITSTEKREALNTILPGSADVFLLQKLDCGIVAYWLSIVVAIFIGFAIGNKLKTREYNAVLPFTIVLFLVWGMSKIPLLGLYRISIALAFPAITVVSYIVAVAFLPFGRYIGSDNQKPVNLCLSDCWRVFMLMYLPGCVIGFLTTVCLHGGTYMAVTVNNVFFVLSVIIFMVVLTKASPLYSALSSERKGTQTPSTREIKPLRTLSSKNTTDALHECFKLLVRDFAGHMQYHCMHQPFLPRCAIFVCVFSWERAQLISLKYARGDNLSSDPPDRCLHEILFWLKNISMHRIHPNYTTQGVQINDKLEENDIKNVVLVGTHKDSCDLKPEEMKMILDYFKTSMKQNPDLYNSLNICVDEIGAISVENCDQGGNDGIDKLKSYLVDCSRHVVQSAFPDPLPVYYWCWLKEKRGQCVADHKPPYELLSESHHCAYLQYKKVYQPHIFKKMLDQFSCIGEIFLVPLDESDDFYIFFDVQFIIDFMKDLINIDDNKMSHREHSMRWTSLKEDGHAPLPLLQEHLKKFLLDRHMEPRYPDKKLELHPLVQSMVHLDFIFILDSEFYLPQNLHEVDYHKPHADFFKSVKQIEWEYVFHFGDFEFHHEFVFFRLLARCAKSDFCTKRAIHSNWASFSLPVQPPQSSEWDGTSTDWFTLSCDKTCPLDGSTRYHNRIVVRVSEDTCKDSSIKLLNIVRGHIKAIVSNNFSKLAISEFFNCPNRKSMDNTHMISVSSIDDIKSLTLCTDEFCEDNNHSSKVRIDPSGLPYIAVSDDILSWLSADIDSDREFNALMSYLFHTHEIDIELKMTDRSKTKNEKKTRIVTDWSHGYNATVDTLMGAFHKLKLHNLEEIFTAKFICQ